jgi:serine/threonine protein kinase
MPLIQILGSHAKRYRDIAYYQHARGSVMFTALSEPAGDRVIIKVRNSKQISAPASVHVARVEASLLLSIRHPFVARCIECLDVTVDGHPEVGLIMEWLPKEWTQEVSKFPEGMAGKQLARSFYEALDALAFLHGQRIALRDLSPESFLLDKTRHLRLWDARCARTTTSNPDLEESARYQAPEVLSGGVRHGRPDDPGPEAYFRADLYSLGLVFYEACVGPARFETLPPLSSVFSRAPSVQRLSMDERWELWHKDPQRALSPLRAVRDDTPEWFSDLILAMVAKDPAKRPANAIAVFDVVRKLVTRHFG